MTGKKSTPFLNCRTEHNDMMKKLDKLIEDIETLKDDNYWAYTKEYWMGLLDASLQLVKKIRTELGD